MCNNTFFLGFVNGLILNFTGDNCILHRTKPVTMIKRRITSKVILLACIMLINVIGYSSNVKFYNVNGLYGISMRETNSVCKDHNGFIWVSSKTGILRLTEDDYRIYQLPYEKANVITARIAYRDSLLLVYTNNGQIFYYNEISDRFDRLVNLGTVLNSNYINTSSLIIGSDNTIWIGTTRGLYRYKNEELVRIEDITPGNSFRLKWYNDHEFIEAKDGVLAMYDTRTEQFKMLYQSDASEAFSLSSILMDRKNNRLWIGTLSDGVYYFDFTEQTLSRFSISEFPRQPVLVMEFNTDSTLFAGVDGQGVWELDIKHQKVVNVYKENANDPNSLRGNGVYDIYKDADERVWVCTYSGGASYFDQASPIVEQLTSQINNANSLVNNDVNGIVEDQKGRLWMATNNGVSCWDRSTNKWRSYYTNKQEQAQVFLTINVDQKGRIWAGTYSSGIYVMDSDTGRELYHYSSKVPNSMFNNDFVFDIHKDMEGDLWIGGINGPVVRFNALTNDIQRFNVEPLYVFADYGDDEMLMGCTYGIGITGKHQNTTRILVGGFLVEDLFVQDSIIWICTSGDGLIRYNPTLGETLFYTTETGLPSNFINSIAVVDHHMWLGTESGLCRFNPADQSVLTYSSIKTFSNLSFNRNAVCLLSDGELAWGSNNGVVIFNPHTIKETTTSGKIFFQDLSISGRSIRDIPSFDLSQPIDKLEHITLKYNQNTVTLELVPVGVAPGSRFSWKMEGLDENWSPPTNNRIITYTNIGSKDFVLNIRLYDSSLSNCIDERSLAIHVTPPFWSTWYFFVIVFLIVTLLIYLALWYYINLLKQKHTEEKVRFFTNTAHDIRTSLTLIKAPVEELSRESKLTANGSYYLNLAREQVTRLSSVVTQLMDFQKVDIGRGQLVIHNVDVVQLVENRTMMFESLALSKEVKIIFTSEQEAFETAVDEMKVEKIVDNLISNAIKYSNSGGEVKVSLKFTENKWYLDVADEGIGISKKAQRQLFKEFYRGDNAINNKIVGSGIGLLLVKNYVNLMGGNVSCVSQENAGSTFQVVFPLMKSAAVREGNAAPGASSSSFSTAEEIQPPVSEEKETNESFEMTVLIVEDNDELRNFIQHALGEEFNVLSAEDGQKAWELIPDKQPDLVVSDIMMPNIDGFELCRLMKSTYETSHIPIILLTALTGKAEQMQGLGLGADDYLTKPFDIVLLQQKIKTIIKNRDAVREKALKLIKADHSEPILKNELNDQFVKKMLGVVHENISNSAFSKDEFAAAMNVSSSLLYKKVKSLTDQSPTDFIKSVRMDYALELLQSRKYSVTEVSEMAGFSSIGYFSTVFKKHFSKSPTEV